MEKYTTSIDLGISAEDNFASAPKTKEKEKRARYKAKERENAPVHKVGIRFYLVNILLGFLILGVVLFILVITLFDLRNIEYEGVVNANTVEIENTLFSDKYSDNTLYAFITNQISPKESVPFVKSANVYLKNMNTLMVSVKEDELSAYIESDNGKYVYIDSNGNVVEVSKKLIEGVPRIEGVAAAEYTEESPLDIDVLKRNNITELIKYLKDINISPNTIIFDADGTYGFYFGNIFVDLGISANVRDKINRLPYILPNIEGRSGILHMEEWGRGNTDIVFEQKI